ncbi:Neural proliferation differentiation and control protein 1 [Zootermopsis nevadensis]|uniref:Neural proliferation differentiation and control protein 1 n=1 Tax=Zootermopsis nevadensis TaxID=136037 RepID=A0A067RGG2_ZOONE|nr:Neural proliferation differentiation and control protein 1 [Zootermopsis nevadensis]
MFSNLKDFLQNLKGSFESVKNDLLHKNAKAAADVEYPAYGVTGPNKEISPTGDRRLAQSAQMYHYQHQKQQIIAMESRVTNERNGSVSEAESEEENEEGDYTVYECPGLASTGEMEVKNPLFQDDPTPVTPAVTPAPAVAGAVVSGQVSSSNTDDKK